MKATTTFKVLGVILAAVVILFGGIGLTGVAAQSAIPGDALYSVKTTIENTRLSLAQDAGDRAQMKLAFAELRLKEIDSLIREGRFREIREAVLAFEANINAAIIELETVSAVDPARAAAITQEVTGALTRYAQVLSDLAVVAPDSVKPEVNRALDTTNIASGLEQINGNENTNVNANDNGSLDDNTNANTNDNSAVDDNGNTNDDGMVDDNSNANVNANDNGDDDSNYNTNTNDSAGDDNSNANVNANDNGDDSANTGVDDNGTVDDNSNDNGDDDSSNDNGDDNSGSGSDDDDDDDSSGKGSGKDD